VYYFVIQLISKPLFGVASVLRQGWL